VYVLLIGAFVPNRWVGFVTLPGITLFAMYFLGIAAAVVIAFALKRTVLRGGRPLYVMELPPYRMPSWRSVLITVRERSLLFLRKAGTVILAISVVLWFLASYPKGGAAVLALETQRAAAAAAGDSVQAKTMDKRIAGAAEVPTMAEAGGPALEAATWVLFLAPAGTPRAIVSRMSAEVAKAVAAPDIKSRFDALGIEPVGNTPEQAGKFLADEIAKWSKVITTAGVKAEQ